jgi:hypothetical protein
MYELDIMYEHGALDLEYLLVNGYAVGTNDPIDHKSKCTKGKSRETTDNI